MDDAHANVEYGDRYTLQSQPTVTLEKLYTPNGNRLCVGDPDEGRLAALDAVQLESLTWQDRGTLRELLSSDTTAADVDRVRSDWREVDGETPDERERVATITNEYAEVYVQVATLGDRQCCEIVSPKRGYGTRLTPAELVAVSRAGHQVFGDFMRTPLGPE